MAKNAAAKTAKKVLAPKPAKVAKPAKAPKAKLVSFTVTAVIPTQQYGNIQPRIEVTASTIAEARAVVMPIIEDMYKTYAEEPLNGKTPKFLGKIEVKERVVSTPAQQAAQGAAMPKAPVANDTPPPATTASTATPKPDAVLKAEKAISLAATHDAALMIQEQITKSVKIPEEFKSDLITLVLHKRNELKDK